MTHPGFPKLDHCDVCGKPAQSCTCTPPIPTEVVVAMATGMDGVLLAFQATVAAAQRAATSLQCDYELVPARRGAR